MNEAPLGGLRLMRVLIPKGQRSKWVLVAFLGMALAFAESLAAVSIALLVDAMIQTDTSAIDLPIIGDIASAIPGETDQAKLQTLALGMTVFFILKAALTLVKVYTEGRVAENTGARIASRLFLGYLTMPYPFHLAHRSSELMRNASWATEEVVSSYLRPIAHIITQATMFIFMLSVLISAAPKATLVTIAILGPMAAVVLRLVKPSLKRLGRGTKKGVQKTLNSLQQTLHGIRDVKILGKERFFGNEYRHTRVELARTRYLHPTIGEIPRLTIQTLLIIVVLGLIAFAGGATAGASLPLLGLFAYAGLRMMPAMSTILRAVGRLRYGSSIAETLAHDLQMVESQLDALPSSESTPLDFVDGIRLEDVSVSYEPGILVLRDIDLYIRKGETIGIVGETGAGKSTLLDVILGLLPPSSGKVEVDGHDLATVVRGWHAIIGLVPQSIYLRDDTLRMNIAYGVNDQNVDEDAVLQAVRLARLDEFVTSLPEGLNTIVGERGVRLSGGERQRVAIARALYRRPQVLVLDEGTAALDTVTETELMRAISDLKGTLTIIMVAHRLSTVRDADRLIMISKGAIVGQGSYEALRKSNLEFRKMTG